MLLRLLLPFLLLATLANSFEYDEPKPSFVSRRAIDGTRGSKHFDPREEGFFDDYGFDNGQYHGNNYKGDIRISVPGEPGKDYPAYLRIPKTSFTCHDKDRGYYADEEAGCQVFHVCDDGQTASFLCPVGSLFSQRLLTCDWWTKVPCSESSQFYSQNPFESSNEESSSSDQFEDNNHVALNVVKTDNRLEQEAPKRKVVGQQRTKFQEVTAAPYDDSQENFRASSTRSYPYSRRRPHYEPTSTTTTPQPYLTSSAIPAVYYYETTTTQAPETTGASFLNEPSTKKDLEDYNQSENASGQSSIESNNSEYYDMEGKESIGLANSHSERNLEKGEEKPTVPVAVEESNESTTVDSTTTTEAVETTTNPDAESMQAKESIGLVQSNQIYNLEKTTTQESSQSSENYGNSDEEANMSTADSTESSTQYYSSPEVPAEATTFAPYVEETSTERVKTQQARKMSGFIHNFAETTTQVADESGSSEYQEPVSSSEPSVTSTIAPSTEPTNDETTTFAPSEVKTTDTVNESNSPLTITLAANDSSVSVKLPNPISADLLGPLVPQHEMQPINVSDIDVEKSSEEAASRESISNENDAASAPQSNVRTYQHFRNYNDQQKINYSPQPQVVSTTFASYQDYIDQYTTTAAPVFTSRSRNSPNDYARYHNYQSQRVRNRQYIPTPRPTTVRPTTTRPTSRPSYRTRYRTHNRNNQNQESQNFDNANRNSKSEKFESYEMEEEPLQVQYHINEPEKIEPTKIQTHPRRPSDSRNLKYYRPELNQPQDFKSYHVNYQTHYYPENYPQHNDDVLDNQNYNYQDSDIPRVENKPQSIDASHKGDDYYQNYDSGESVDDGTNVAGEFGVKISVKTPTDSGSNENPNEAHNADAYTINLGLQDNGANLLYAMSQLANGDRSPRPFVSKSYTPSMNNIHDMSHLNNVASVDKIEENQYVQPTGELTAPKLEVNEKTLGDYNFKVYANGKFDKVKATYSPSQYENRTKHGRILNVTPTTQKPVQNPEPQVTSFGSPSSTPAAPLDYNQYQPVVPQINSFSTPSPIPADPNQNYQFQQPPQFSGPSSASEAQPEMNQYQFQQLPQVGPFNTPSQVPEEAVQVEPNHNYQQVSQLNMFNPSSTPAVPVDFNQNQQYPQYTPSSTPQVPLDYNQNEQYQPQLSTFGPPNPIPESPVDYSQNQDYQSVPQQENSDYESENSQVPDKNVQFPVNPQPQTPEYGFVPIVGPSLQPPHEPHQVFKPDYSVQPNPQVDYSTIPQDNVQPTGFQHTTQSAIENAEYIESLQNLQPPRIDALNSENEVPHDSQPTYDAQDAASPSIEEINNLKTELQPPKIDPEYRPTRPKQRVADNENTQFLPTAPSASSRNDASQSTTTALPQVTDTEFIPSLSFDIGSDEGKKKFLAALERGLVPDDDSKVINIEVRGDAGVEREQRSSKSVKSEEEPMDNFKDSSEVMKGTE